MILEYQLQFHSPLVGTLDSDMIMGSMAWALLRCEGEQALQSWIDMCKQGNPPFVVSNGFPTGFFPKPMIPFRKKEQPLHKQEQIKEARTNKKLKARKWVSTNLFYEMLNGTFVQMPGMDEPRDFIGQQIHAIIDRTTGTSLTEGGLYETSYRWFSMNISLYFQIFDLSWENRIDDLMKYLEYEGIGAKKSIGYGRFRIITKQHMQVRRINNPNGFVVLSHFVPSRDDSTNGFYKIKTKYGRLGEEFSKGVSVNPFKKPILMIEHGACFYTQKPQKFCGRILSNISFNHTDKVVQMCYGFIMPARLPIIDGNL
ncbi:hypothetical protein LSG31_10340 [Fodinisporobacter ferrooxydans]|uniref:CRISPR system Cms protein Csm4 n=1 Tax=Fodinisporobacter ferrooxydans TaxID=2901836 RepID=A0ABY4CSV0_9BACL|nr:hypothetical protein LSG31_10340 [Alicyclobacillaceae bacterium MYW30-H2]